MSLPSLAVRRGVTAVMFYLGLFLLSAMAFQRLSLDMLPDVDFPSITVTVVYEGADPETVENMITRRIEGVVSVAENLKEIESESREGLSRITLKFNWGSDLDAAANDVRERLDIVKAMLPEEAETPRIFKFNLSQFPIMWAAVSAKESYPRLYTILDKQVIEPLKRVPGVANAWIQGAPRRQINVWVDRHRLEAHGATLADVITGLRANNFAGRSGDLRLGLDRYVLRTPGEFETIDDIRQAPFIASAPEARSSLGELARAAGGGRTGAESRLASGVLRVADVAEVQDGYVDREDRVRVNGEPGVGLVIQKRSGANTVEVAEAVKRELPRIFAQLPADLSYQVVRDGSEDIRRNLNNLTTTVYIGGLLVVLVTLLFLRSWRASFIVLVTIPFSLVVSFLFLYLMGYTINVISLSSLAIAIGMVVDNAIVVVDNFQRRRQERGEPVREAAVKGTMEVGVAVSASTLTTVVIFLPVIFLGGIVGVLFKQLAFTVTLTLGISLLLSLTLSPLMCSRLWKDGPARGPEPERNGTMARVEAAYVRALSRVLAHPGRLAVGCLVAFLATLALVPGLKREFFPEGDEARVNVSFSLIPGTDIGTTDQTMGRIEKLIEDEVPERLVMLSTAGRPPVGVRGFSDLDLHKGRLIAALPPIEKRARHVTEINNLLRPKLMRLPGMDRVSFSGGGLGHFITQGQAVTAEVYGYDLASSYEIARQVKGVMETIPGLGDVQMGREAALPEFQIEIDRMKAAELGVPVVSLAEVMEAAFAGKRATVFRDAGEEYEVIVRYRPEDRRTFEALRGLPVRTLGGSDVPLSTLASIRPGGGPLSITRKDQSRVVEVSANPAGADLGTIVKRLDAGLAKIPLPEGVRIRLGGMVKEQRESFGFLKLAFLLSLALTYMVMASQFESLRLPFVLMFTIPPALMGIVWALRLFDVALAVPSYIGIILVVGIAVNNGIVFLDYSRQLEAGGMGAREALLEAGRCRLRPILMTSLTTIFGMVPMATMRLQGGEFWQPMAIAVISGLLVSMLLTLFLIPSLSLLFRSRRASSPLVSRPTA